MKLNRISLLFFNRKGLWVIFLLIGFHGRIHAASNSHHSFYDKGSDPDSSLFKHASIIILGTIQDAGSPHIGCEKKCCIPLFLKPDSNRKVVALGLVDPLENRKYLFEATPDIASQLKLLNAHPAVKHNALPDGIFLTHAHIGHYTGLMYLGKEAMSARRQPVYAMPLMKMFLETNGPWSQLVKEENILLNELTNEVRMELTENLSVTPFTVPHRDEYSETVGYKMEGTKKKALFIPDIDKWEKWEKNIVREIAAVDYAFIDATFYSGDELNNRDMSLIPHPLIVESMNLFSGMPESEKRKVYFIHFNHTNPALDRESFQRKQIIDKGFNIAEINDIFQLD